MTIAMDEAEVMQFLLDREGLTQTERSLAGFPLALTAQSLYQRINTVLDMHAPTDESNYCPVCTYESDDGLHDEWPCPTVLALGATG